MALANFAAEKGFQVTLWEFDPKAAATLQKTRERPSVLFGSKLHDQIKVTHKIEQTLENPDFILLVIPSHAARSVLEQIARIDSSPTVPIISCIKGIENDSLMRISEIVQDTLDFDMNRFAVLSGPSHAEEVNRHIITAVVVASPNHETAELIQRDFNSKTFRFYTSTDVVGVELGGALKNVIAIAAGICDGAGFGDNTKAALQPRGLAEIARLGRKLGADSLTFGGLSGMGDLIVTCMSRHSRNRYVGEQIGAGKTLEEVLSGMTMVAEGVKTCRSGVALAQKYDVELPICQEVYDILFNNKSAKEALTSLMTREVKPEVWG
jgi:glycerol-3-phosphate dehydrogenase (NAD(P)+)